MTSLRYPPLYNRFSYAVDAEILNLLAPFETKVIEEGSKSVGRSNVLLSNACRDKECNMGESVYTQLIILWYWDMEFTERLGRSLGA